MGIKQYFENRKKITRINKSRKLLIKSSKRLEKARESRLKCKKEHIGFKNLFNFYYFTEIIDHLFDRLYL